MSSSNGGGGTDLSQTQQQASQPTQQQWMQPQWMQYPAAAMAMMQQQQMLMYAHPQYLPYHYQQQLPHHQQHHLLQQHQQSFHPHHNNQQKQQQNGSIGGEEAKTIWVGDLHHWMDETYLHTCFNQTGEVYAVKVIRNKQTGQSEGYGFVEFSSHATAEKVLQSYSASVMPNTDQPFRLNWAVFSSGNRQSENGSDLSIFVGDLAADVTDTLLQETFSSKYPSVKGAKVVIDSNTGRSKGYGFVRFADENERLKAMTEMNGVFCLSRPMRIGVATPKKASGGGGGGGYNTQQFSQVLAGGNLSNGAASQGSQGYTDSNNTTIFVGGLDADISDEDLRQPFSQFGEVVSVKIPVGKGCGFVQFANRKSAEDAMQELNGTVIGKQSVRLSWGRTPANKQWRNDNGSQWNGVSYYGGGQGYGEYSNGNSAAAVANGAS